MKLFDGFEAIVFPQENKILITHHGYLYYIYDREYKRWEKYRRAGHDHLTVANYPDVSRKALAEAMQGVFPKKETDFMRLCGPAQLYIGDMMCLLREDHADYMSDHTLYHMVDCFLSESAIPHKSFEAIRNLLDHAAAQRHSSSQVAAQIKDLSFKIIGRDIFKGEIGIVDGHDGSSYFWIMPVRVIDDSDTNQLDHVARMKSAEISIEEDDVAQYLTPFLYAHFDNALEANRKRMEDAWIDDDGNTEFSQVSGFEWNLTYNFFTFDSIADILQDIRDTIDALSSGRETEYTKKLKIKRGTSTHRLLYAKNLSEEEIAAYNANRPTEDDTETERIIDFYRRFLYRMEYMMKVGKEKGYDLISFMGP